MDEEKGGQLSPARCYLKNEYDIGAEGMTDEVGGAYNRPHQSAPRLATGTIGFPRIGRRRQLKYILEQYWEGQLGEEEMLMAAQEVEEEAWQVQADAEIEFIGVGDFNLYDWVLQWIDMLGCVPPRFRHMPRGPLRFFSMARGLPDARALEMRKWFDTNYHYLVPELEDIEVSADFTTLFTSVRRARQKLGEDRAVPMLLGPITFIWLAHIRPTHHRRRPSSGPQGEEGGAGEVDERDAVFQRSLSKLLPVYCQLLEDLAGMGVKEVQMHEPAMISAEGVDLLPSFQQAYHLLLSKGVGLDLVTYFADMHEDVYETVVDLPFQAVTLDFTHGGNLVLLKNHGFPAAMRLGVGLLNARSCWKPDSPEILPDTYMIRRSVKNIRLQPSCSLQFLPFSVRDETSLKNLQLETMVSFATEKLDELRELADAAVGEETMLETEWDWTALKRDISYEVSHTQESPLYRLKLLQSSDFIRSLTYEERQSKQIHRRLPPLPTTTVGSFPQSDELRKARRRHQTGEAGSEEEYKRLVQAEIKRAIKLQEEVGLDILVNGEAERADTVEYFASQLEGVVTTNHGWVQVYGNRCVRPPIIWGDINRPHPITVDEFLYAQSLTSKPVKAILPGPLTLFNWSFPRVDKTRRDQCLQLALCIRDEVRDLEIAGAKIVQVDEPGFREGMPLKGQKREEYLAFARQAFRLATCIAGPQIEIHTHLCYTEVDDCLPTLLDFDADVYLVENARGGDHMVMAFKERKFNRMVAPGVFDVHSPVEPPVEEMKGRIRKILETLPVDRVLVAPDSGLKTRTWEEVEASLRNMVEATVVVRQELNMERRKTSFSSMTEMASMVVG